LSPTNADTGATEALLAAEEVTEAANSETTLSTDAVPWSDLDRGEADDPAAKTDGGRAANMDSQRSKRRDD